MKFFTSALLAVALTLPLTACGNGGGPGTKGYCREQTECEFGTNRDYNACLETWEYEKEIAKVYGCRREYADKRDCFVANSFCDFPNRNYLLVNPDICLVPTLILNNCIDVSSNNQDSLPGGM